MTRNPINELQDPESTPGPGLQPLVGSFPEESTLCPCDDAISVALSDADDSTISIQSLPAELLLDIFLYCLPIHEVHPYLYPSHPKTPEESEELECISVAPFILTWVSAYWRRLMLSDPTIWAIATVDFRNAHGIGALTVFYFEQHMLRSGDVPLSITFFGYQGVPLVSDADASLKLYTGRIISLLEPHFCRVSSLHLAGDSDPFWPWSSDMQVNFPRLRTLHFSHGRYSMVTQNGNFEWLKTARNLTDVSLTDGSMIHPLLSALSSLPGIVSLSDREGDFKYTHSVLSHFLQIKRASLEFSSDFAWTHRLRLKLSKLEEITIRIATRYNRSDPSRWKDPLPRFFEIIDPPALTSFSLDYGERIDADTRVWCHDAFMSFVRRCSLVDRLTKLELENMSGMSQAMLGEILLSLPNLAHLLLGGLGTDGPDGHTVTAEFLWRLAVPPPGQPSSPNLEPDAEYSNIPLRKLRALHLNLPRYEILPQRLAAVAQIVESRLSSSDCVQLERLRLTLGGDFTNTAVLDSLRRLRDCAENMGLDLGIIYRVQLASTIKKTVKVHHLQNLPRERLEPLS